jgi:hypothetical protein
MPVRTQLPVAAFDGIEVVADVLAVWIPTLRRTN